MGGLSQVEHSQVYPRTSRRIEQGRRSTALAYVKPTIVSLKTETIGREGVEPDVVSAAGVVPQAIKLPSE
jgi:hypothetical protein